MTAKRKQKAGTIHVVSSTHWDREWYCTYAEYRFRLVEHIRLLLDMLKGDKAYRTFHFDGQTAALFDHLEIRPQDARELRKMVAAGRIVPGPWFVLADEALVSGESLVHNLKTGTSDSRELGFTGRWCGYVPDQFGHVAQMPQILRQFGIGTAFMARGFKESQLPKGSGFRWRGPDGSELFALFCDYGNGLWLHDSELGSFSAEKAKEVVDRHLETSPSGDVILIDGVDHFPPNLKLTGRMKKLSKIAGMKVRHSTLHEAMEAMRKGSPRRLPLVEGEIRNDLTAANIDLNGVLSSRMYLKQANRAVETLLERWAEPFAAFAMALGALHKTEDVGHARRTLLLNHPHDSICGCSVDPVHRQMMTRFEEAGELAECLFRRAVTDAVAITGGGRPPYPPDYPCYNWPRFSDGTKEMPVALINAVAAPIREASLLKYERPGGWEAGDLAVETVGGEAVPFQPVSKALAREWGLHTPETLNAGPFWRPGSAFVMPGAEVPGCGMLGLRLKHDPKSRPVRKGPVTSGRNWIANEHVKATVAANGSVTVRAGGATFRGLNTYEDGGDEGSGYHYKAPESDRVISSKRARARVPVVERGPLAGVIRSVVTMKGPEGLGEGGGRSRRLVPLKITTYYVIRAGAPNLEVRTVAENRAVDHRLRAVFPTGLATRSVLTDAPFAFTERPAGPRPYPEKPQGDFVFVPGKRGGAGLVLANRGLPEYECSRDGTVSLTLMRSLSMTVRQWWPGVESVESAMQGRSVYEYAVAPAADVSQAARLAERFKLPAMCMPLPTESREPTESAGFLEVSGGARLSTVEAARDERGAIDVRLYNPGSKRTTARLDIGFSVKRAWAVDLAGKRTKHKVARSMKDGRSKISVALGRCEIVTVRLVPVG